MHRPHHGLTLAIALLTLTALGAECPTPGLDDDLEMPGTVVIAGSRTGKYVLVHPQTGADLVEVQPDVHLLLDWALSHDGSTAYLLAPTEAGSGENRIFGCDALTGENLRQLFITDDHAEVFHMDGSPTAAEIAYSAAWRRSDDDGWGEQVFVIDEAGTDLRQLSTVGDEIVLPPDCEGSTLLTGSRPAWSPDGDRLAFVARVYRDDNPGVQFEVITVMNPDGTDKRGKYVFPGTAHYDSLCWTVDGEHLLWREDGADGRRYVQGVWIDDEEGNATDLSANLRHDEWDIGEFWCAPDRTQIVMNYKVPGGGDLYTVSYDSDAASPRIDDTPTRITDSVGVGHGYAEPDWGFYGP